MKAGVWYRDGISLVPAGEFETLEFKATTRTLRGVAMTVCAFLNRSGGRALFGVDSSEAAVGGGGCAD